MGRTFLLALSCTAIVSVMCTMTETRQRLRGHFKFLLLLIACVLVCIMMEGYFHISTLNSGLEVDLLRRNMSSEIMQYTQPEQYPDEKPVVVTLCKYYLPKGNKITGRAWAEDASLNETPVIDHLLVANASLSKFSILNPKLYYRLGEQIHVLVEVYDGYGRRRNVGGDMLRVWMRERTLNASSASRIQDNGNGTYTAILEAFWPGMPEIKAVLIHPKEVIETYFRRRFKCPQVQHMTAIFEHPVHPFVTETTVCNIIDFVPGYKDFCNFTRDNYGYPLYCGKPVSRRLQCSDWTKVGKRLLWPDQEHNLTHAERFLLLPENKATFLPGIERVLIKEGNVDDNVTKQWKKCYEVARKKIWDRSSPIGYFYRGVWYDSLCPGHSPSIDNILKTCLKNRTMYMFGDSTVRQWHYAIQERINCTFMTDTWDESHKHRPVTCVDRNLNFTLQFSPHGLPFFADNAPKRFYRPIATNLEDMKDEENTIVLIHVFAHMMSYHSSTFYDRMLTIRNAIQGYLNKNPTATVIIKGPHYYSFEKKMHQSLWMLDRYADIYSNILKELFKILADRVVYIDCMDITISAENDHIHPRRQTITEMLNSMFYKICQY